MKYFYLPQFKIKVLTQFIAFEFVPVDIKFVRYCNKGSLPSQIWTKLNKPIYWFGVSNKNCRKLQLEFFMII